MRCTRLWLPILSLVTLFLAVDCSDGYVSGKKQSCENGEADADETDIDCGGPICERCADGDKCNQNSDCSDALTCGDAGLCVFSHCTDKTKNGDESDKDCGGSCVDCVAGKACIQNGDCESTLCKNKQCTEASCSDGTKNQEESDVDCGDATGICDGCAAGKVCSSAANCASGICSNGLCTNASCSDGVKNGTEGDKDCGGTCPTLCATGAACVDMVDCVTSVCTKSECQGAACNDTVRNGGETDVDCGGSACSARCGLGKGCGVNSDCAINSCSSGICQDPSCSNNSLDGTETSKDCGGTNCAPCTEGLACRLDSDCVSLHCLGLVCAPATCGDQIKNGLEPAVDCGGDCNQKCEAGLGCGANKDCVSGKCSGGVCQVPSCTDAVQNDLETDADCGGALCVADGRACVNGRKCLADTDCQSSVCNAASGLCQAQSCADGRKNQDESDIDCGGACSPCPTGKRCSHPTTGVDSPANCADGVCSSGRCALPTCTDEVKNGAEGDLDCGAVCITATGAADLCQAGNYCNNHADCVQKVCGGAYPTKCQPASCADGEKNGAELDTDCMDPVGCPAKKCQAGQACATTADCDVIATKGMTCACSVTVAEGAACPLGTGTCTAPGCNDKLSTTPETDVDCGGPSCAPCAVGKLCLANTDCEPIASGRCAVVGTTKKCVEATCSDGVKNGAETSVDCGGSGDCVRCGTGAACETASDCASGVCDANVCQAPTCTDSVKNGDETAADCGGGCSGCRNDDSCRLDADCISGWCNTLGTSPVCAARTCDDAYQNGLESDLNCGAVCNDALKLCADGKKCGSDLDCSSTWCQEWLGTCALKDSWVPNCLRGNGPCLQGTLGKACDSDRDCLSFNCNTTSKKCEAAVANTPNNCGGNLLTAGTVCSAGSSAKCMAYLRCFASVGKPADPCNANRDDYCGMNKVGSDTSACNLAVAAAATCPAGFGW